jgi:hypothetical protein
MWMTVVVRLLSWGRTRLDRRRGGINGFASLLTAGIKRPETFCSGRELGEKASTLMLSN